MDYNIEEIDVFPARRASSAEYRKIYEMLDALPIDGKRRVGPFTLKQAQSAQTSITEYCKGNPTFKIFTAVRLANPSLKPPKDYDGQDVYVYVMKVARIDGDEKEEEVKEEAEE